MQKCLNGMSKKEINIFEISIFSLIKNYRTNLRSSTIDGENMHKLQENNKSTTMITKQNKSKWLNSCFRGKKELNVPPDRVISESVVFDLSE